MKELKDDLRERMFSEFEMVPKSIRPMVLPQAASSECLNVHMRDTLVKGRRG